MRERLVRFRHSVRVFFLLDGAAGVVVGIHELSRELFAHLALGTLSRIDDEPADRKRLTALGTDLDGDLIVCTADAARFDFDDGRDVRKRLLEDLHGVHIQLFPHDLERIVDDALRDALLAVQHDLVDEFGDDLAAVHRIGQDVSLGNFPSSGHSIILLYEFCALAGVAVWVSLPSIRLSLARLGVANLLPFRGILPTSSGRYSEISRVTWSQRDLLRALRAVLGARLLALCNACRIERAADDVIADAGQILDSPAADKNGAVLLQVVAFAGNVHGTFLLVGKAHPCDLTQCRVGLLGGSRRHRKAYAALLRARVEDGALRLVRLRFSAFFDELVDRGHFVTSL